ncbi:MAG: DUF6335 family protein [Vicinamibacterales bacterium]
MAKTARKSKHGSKARAGKAAKKGRSAAGAARKARPKVRSAARATAKAKAKRPKKKAAKPAAPKKTARKAVATRVKGATRAATRKKAAKRAKPAAKAPARKPVATATRRAAAKPVRPARAAASPTRKPATPAPAAKVAPRKAPGLDRERRTVGEAASAPSSWSPGHASAAKSGGDELRVKLAAHTGSGPALTGGDIDADWASAEAVGDEAPGGDNPTPDQDVVDEIGRALGVEYDDDEELQGGEEIAERDRDRWELDPASSDDFDER